MLNLDHIGELPNVPEVVAIKIDILEHLVTYVESVQRIFGLEGAEYEAVATKIRSELLLMDLEQGEGA